METVGERIRRLRIENKMKQHDIIASFASMGVVIDRITISPWLFPSEDAEMPNPHRSYKQWKTFTATLGINVPPYSMRHTHVSIMKELPIGWLKTILGHGADMDTFGIYGHVVDGEIKEASIKTVEILKRHIKTS